jgi:magnesium-protoporphyrin O-methyltransferase
MSEAEGNGPAKPPARDCCCPADEDARIARYFDRRNQRRRSGAEKYEMGDVSKRLLEVLVERGPAGHSVLEGGCGPGALLVGLLQAGAASGTGIDLSAEAIEYARERAGAAGVIERAEFKVGDAALVDVPAHDWVVLDKVICCYPHMEALLDRTTSEAKGVFAFAVPISWGWRGAVIKVFLAIEGAFNRLMRRACSAYAHDIPTIEARLRSAGFGSVLSENRGMWHIGVFART